MTGTTGESRSVTRVLPLPADLATRDRARRDAERVARLTAPTLAPLIEVRIVPTGLALVHAEPAAARPLPEAAERSRDRVVRALADAAAGLAALHAAGIAHGAVGAELVLVDDDGRAVLSGAGLGCVLAGPPADDVRALADAALDLLPRRLGGSLAQLLVRAADADSAVRPSAAELAAALGTAARRLEQEPPTRPVPVVRDRGVAADDGGLLATITQAAEPDAARAADPAPAEEVRAAEPAGAAVAVDEAPPSPPARRRGVVGPEAGARPTRAARNVTVPARRRPAASAGRVERRGAGDRRSPRVTGLLRVGVPVGLAALLVVGAGALRATGGTLDPAPPPPAAAPPEAPPPEAPPPEAAPPEAPPPDGSVGPEGSGLVSTGPDATPSPRAVTQAGRSAAPDPVAVPAPDRGAAASPEAAPDWRAVVTALDDARALAYEAAEPALLSDVAVPGSPAWRRDEAALAALQRRGESVTGLRTVLVAVRPLRVGRGTATLLVTDRRSSYTLLGAVTQRRPAAPQRSWTVTLQRTPDGWRYRSAQPR